MGPAWRRIVQVIGARWGWEPRRARALGQWGDLFQPRFCASVTSKISMEVAHTAVEKLSSSHSGSSPIFNGLHDRGSSRQAPAQLDVSTSLAFVACDADHAQESSAFVHWVSLPHELEPSAADAHCEPPASHTEPWQTYGGGGGIDGGAGGDGGRGGDTGGDGRAGGGGNAGGDCGGSGRGAQQVPQVPPQMGHSVQYPHFPVYTQCESARRWTCGVVAAASRISRSMKRHRMVLLRCAAFQGARIDR